MRIKAINRGARVGKSVTGIPGFDDISMGGLPTGRTTVLIGGPGTGKTVFALQVLVNAARDRGEAGIFVAFEQDPATVRADAASFDWDLDALPKDVLTFIDARPILESVRVGEFDIAGMLALLDVTIRAADARMVVFDGIDVLLAQMECSDVIRRELYRLQDWLDQQGMTALITCKATISDPRFIGLPSLEFLQYMVACSILLNHDIVEDVSQRSLRIVKYRGSGFHGNVVPFLIGVGGLDVTAIHPPRPTHVRLLSERLSSGVTEVDAMLSGGYFRTACILLTGLPGTGKTTFCGAFLAAACARGERAVFVSFVSRGEEIVKNLQSVSIDLQTHIDTGMLRVVTTRASIGSAETHMRSIRTIAREHDATCIVIDPMSALTSFVNTRPSPGVTERLIDWAKDEGRTLVCTGLLGDPEDLEEPPALQIATIADTWIHLNNTVLDCVRSRNLAVIKSRGTGHSREVRGFAISDAGLHLTEIGNPQRPDGDRPPPAPAVSDVDGA